MSILYTATINSRFYMSGDKKEFDDRLKKAQLHGEDVEDRKRHALDELELSGLESWLELTGSRDTDPTKSAIKVLQEAIKEAEEDEF